MQKLLHFWRKIYLCIVYTQSKHIPLPRLPTTIPTTSSTICCKRSFVPLNIFRKFQRCLVEGTVSWEKLHNWGLAEMDYCTVDLNHQLHNMLFTFFWSAVKGILSRDGLDSSHRPHMSFTFSDQLLKCYNLFVVSIFAWFSWTAAVWTQV